MFGPLRGLNSGALSGPGKINKGTKVYCSSILLYYFGWNKIKKYNHYNADKEIYVSFVPIMRHNSVM